MKYEFDIYQDRAISFKDVVKIDDYDVKVYTISNRPKFSSSEIYNNAIGELPFWLEHIKASSLPTYKVAFLIVHEAREGVLILLNWWTGENMLETKIYFADFNTPKKISPSLYGTKQLVCIWELEIFCS